MKSKYIFQFCCLGFFLGIVASSSAAFGQQLDKVKVARLAFPAMGSLLLDVLIERGIDKKHGFHNLPRFIAQAFDLNVGMANVGFDT